MIDNNISPIVLFVYNRLYHTRLTIESLLRNPECKESILFIFSDGAKELNDLEKQNILKNEINSVRNFIKSIKGFKDIIIIEREYNLGLANSIIDGVTKVVNEYGKVIVLEDDLITSPFFLKYMNEALNLYEYDNEVCSIQGYMYNINKKLPETFFLKVPDCWGWATWKRAWNLFEKDGKKLLEELKSKKLIDKFNSYHFLSLSDMLKDQIEGKNNSWAIRWIAVNFINNKLTLYPCKSLIQNIGNDSSGTHKCNTADIYYTELAVRPIKINRQKLVESKKAIKILRYYFKRINSKNTKNKHNFNFFLILFNFMKKIINYIKKKVIKKIFKQNK